MSNILYFILMFTWVIYIVQEMFISGSSALNIVVCKDEGERKQIQVATGLHWDGIEVWLLASLLVTLAVFPIAFSTVFEFLYVPIFLLLYALITRGLSIEVLYKMDSVKWVKWMKNAWSISSIAIVFILGIYITNMFLGYPFDGSSMTKSFASIFNVTGISGGLLFVAASLLAGSSWIDFTTSGDLGSKATMFVKKTGVIYALPILLLLVFMGLNNLDTSIFRGELFSSSIVFFILPLLTLIGALLTSWFGVKRNSKMVFTLALLTISLFLITGFIGNYPYVIPSSILFENGITISSAAVEQKSLVTVFIGIAIFYPIVLFYQNWKYRKFAKVKVHYNDDLEG